MRPIKIFTDTCSDLTENMLEKYDIVSIKFTIYFNGKEVDATPWDKVKPRELYDSLRAGTRVYTLPATEHEIAKNFKKYADEFDIIYIAACEKQSTTIVKARKVASNLCEKNPDYRIEIIDSLNASIGEGLLAIKAAEMRDQGMSFEDIVSKITAIRNNVIQFATVDTLTYLSKANKINARVAALGNLLKISPILISDAEGNQTSLVNTRGREKSLNMIIDKFMENVTDTKDQDIYIIHGDEKETAFMVKEELLRRNLECREIIILCVGPVVGITTGPGMVGLFGFGKEVTYKGE